MLYIIYTLLCNDNTVHAAHHDRRYIIVIFMKQSHWEPHLIQMLKPTHLATSWGKDLWHHEAAAANCTNAMTKGL